jgi:hypothetical protein
MDSAASAWRSLAGLNGYTFSKGIKQLEFDWKQADEVLAAGRALNGSGQGVCFACLKHFVVCGFIK